MKETNREYMSSGERKYISLKVILKSMKKDDSTSKTKIIIKRKYREGKIKNSKVNSSHSMTYLLYNGSVSYIY